MNANPDDVPPLGVDLAQDARVQECAVPGCGRAIRENADGQWLDETRDPAFCPTAATMTHRPADTTEDRR